MLRDALQIQRAHDLLVGCLTDPRLKDKLPEGAAKVAAAQADVLCWVLEHQHNPRFGEELRLVEAALREAGVELTDSGELLMPRARS